MLLTEKIISWQNLNIPLVLRAIFVVKDWINLFKKDFTHLTYMYFQNFDILTLFLMVRIKISSEFFDYKLNKHITKLAALSFFISVIVSKNYLLSL